MGARATIHCPSCGHSNRPDRRFCTQCGSRLGHTCTTCGTPVEPSEKFCGTCGAPLTTRAAFTESLPATHTPKHLVEKILGSRSALEGERKRVTVLFADVQGSMELAEQMDPEAWSAIMQRFFRILADGVERFEGFVDKFTGDGIMALFGAPIAHEDHAQRACYAALHLREETARYVAEVKREHGIGFSTRMGINSGEVVVGTIGADLRMSYTAQGHTVGLAQRMQSLAESGHICLSEHTARLIEGYFQLQDLGRTKVKGASEPVRIFDLEGMGSFRTRFDRSRSRGLSRLVGRDRDVAVLEAALERARSGSGQVVGVVAEAGIGKSRLCAEFVDGCRASGLPIFEAHGVAHGKAIPMLPMLELWRAFYGIPEGGGPEATRAKIAERLLLMDESLREQLPFLFDLFGVPDLANPAPAIDPEQRQKHLHSLLHDPSYAGTRVILLEDLHWFDAASDAFLEAMVECVPATRDLLLVNFRPEYRASWMQRPYYQALPLQPLGPEAIRALLCDQLGDDASVAALAETIHARTKGNPFFIEEVVQSLVESGHLAGARGAYRLTTAVEALEVPASVQAVLAARIDRLPEREKQVLQTAAVIGKTFSEALLRRVMASVAAIDDTELSAALSALAAGEFLYEAALYPQREYSFKHPLTREVAQRSQLRERRIRVHGEAAVQAKARFAYGETRLHLEAALDLLREQPETLERLRQEMALLEDLGTTLFGMRGYGDEDGARAFARMRQLAERLDAARTRSQAMEGQLTGHTMRAEFTAARALGEEMLLLAEQLGNPAEAAIALSLLGATLFNLGEVEAALQYAERARALWDPEAPPLPNDVGIPSSILVASACGYFGRVARAREMNREALARADTLGTPFHTCMATNLAAQVCMLLDDVPAARSLAEQAVHLAVEYDLGAFRLWATMVRGWCDVEEGRVDDGLTALLDAFREYGATGQRYGTTSFSMLLARAHLAAGDVTSAKHVVDAALAFAAETGERVYEPEFHRLKGECLLASAATRGRRADAIEHFERALAIAADRNALLFELRAATSLCRVQKSERERLAHLVERFGGEDDCADLRTAKALLEELG